MKHTKKRGLLSEVMKAIAITMVAVAAGIAITLVFTGCGAEDPLEPTADLTKETAVGVFARAKYNNTAPAAPSAPQGTPRVTEVSYWHDWKLTKPVTSPVQPGKTIFIKVVFSEPMKHIVSDGKEARPILYYKRAGKELVRFKMAAHGANGKNFASGDAKPLHNGTDDFICKYIVPEEEVAIMIGKHSTDLQGNPLANFYGHPVKIGEEQSGLLNDQNVQDDQNDNTPIKVVEVSYYADERFTEPLMSPVMEGTTIFTKIVFSRAVTVVVSDGSSARPKIFYNADGGFRPETQYRIKQRNADLQNGEAKLFQRNNNIVICRGRAAWVRVGWLTTFRTQVDNHTLKNELRIVTRPVESFLPPDGQEYPAPVGRSGDFIGQVRVPIESRSMEYSKPLADVVVTIVSGPQAGANVITDEGGHYLFPNIRGNELHVRVEREYFEPKEAIVHRSRPTTLPDRVPIGYPLNAQNTPGTILIGIRWPDEVRFILEEVHLAPDVLLSKLMFKEGRSDGSYGPGLVKESGTGHTSGTLAHELMHAHQHAIVHPRGGAWSRTGILWENTLEGEAYVKAMYKDFQEVGKMDDDLIPGYDEDVPFENAAVVCSWYWIVDAIAAGEGLKVKAPNRYKWCQEWLNKKYD